VTGYWFAPEQPRLPDALTRFLDAGDPPVFVGFGSMARPDPAATTAVVLGAARRAGVRAVLGTGWGGLDATASDDVFVIDDVPYEHLFPRIAAVVHHGGAGTVAAAAAAGRPQVVCPFVADQPFWGRRMHDLGVATEPIRQRHLSPDRLATVIHEAVTAPRLATTAAELGSRIRTERGVDNAVGQLEHIVEAHIAGT
jgi:sterol 3beta-glucosyltransferase